MKFSIFSTSRIVPLVVGLSTLSLCTVGARRMWSRGSNGRLTRLADEVPLAGDDSSSDPPGQNPSNPPNSNPSSSHPAVQNSAGGMLPVEGAVPSSPTFLCAICGDEPTRSDTPHQSFRCGHTLCNEAIRGMADCVARRLPGTEHQRGRFRCAVCRAEITKEQLQNAAPEYRDVFQAVGEENAADLFSQLQNAAQWDVEDLAILNGKKVALSLPGIQRDPPPPEEEEEEEVSTEEEVGNDVFEELEDLVDIFMRRNWQILRWNVSSRTNPGSPESASRLPHLEGTHWKIRPNVDPRELFEVIWEALREFVGTLREQELVGDAQQLQESPRAWKLGVLRELGVPQHGCEAHLEALVAEDAPDMQFAGIEAVVLSQAETPEGSRERWCQAALNQSDWGRFKLIKAGLLERLAAENYVFGIPGLTEARGFAPTPEQHQELTHLFDGQHLPGFRC
jgi:hypothetical protein